MATIGLTIEQTLARTNNNAIGKSITLSPMAIVGSRVKERMEAAGLSQAELARRVGLSQPTIFQLIHRSKKGSTHLHVIARELGTTPAYLTGETDDPDSDAPDAPAFSRDDIELLERMALLSDRARALLLALIDELSASPGRTLHPTRKGYRAQS